ncbi:MAG TPA: LssY C-terminal domain-containing protein [Candidatus Binatia bacterium]
MMRPVLGPRRTLAAWLVLSLALHGAGCSAYRPTPPDPATFRHRAQAQTRNDVTVTVAVLDADEASRVFGVSLYRRGIQPIWIEVHNGSDGPYLLSKPSIDPHYYSPLEASYVSHYRTTGYLPGGLKNLLLLPLVVPGALQSLGARRANAQMDEYFLSQGFGSEVIGPGETESGFVFAGIDEGTRKVNVVLYGEDGKLSFRFLVPMPDIERDLDPEGIARLHPDEQIVHVDETGLRTALEAMPCCTTDADGTKYGDPVNLVVIGDLEDILDAFSRAGWYETERIHAGSIVRTVQSFLFGSTYRVSPVSDLYLFGRRQDIAFQKVRRTVDDRHHFRLWVTWLRFQGKPVWVGQASRDIGVRFTTQTWNLTTHKIDPEVDDARDYVIGDLVQQESASLVGYVEGVGAAPPNAPRENLTGDPYFTDGWRAFVVLAEPPAELRVTDLR